jgi:hypothetical protein
MNNLAHLLPAHISSGNAAEEGIAAERSDGAAKGGAEAAEEGIAESRSGRSDERGSVIKQRGAATNTT